MQVSVVIITKNEALNIIDCILSARKISDDIIVIDSSSTDATVAMAEGQGVKVKSISWRGYGYARNTGAELATNDWIFALDADERLTDEFASVIAMLDPVDDHIVYSFRRQNFFAGEIIRYGEMAHDHASRIYHREYASWDAAPVHEKLTGNGLRHQPVIASILHYGIRSKQQFLQKSRRYAYLGALKYKQANKKHSGILRHVSPLFHFIKAYFFQLGILDGRMGFKIARVNAWYTWQKYEQLHQMLKEEKRVVGEMNFIRASLKRITSFLS